MNEKNLNPIVTLSKEEAKRRGSKGGKASAESRRRKRDMDAKMKALLELPAAANDSEQLVAFVFSSEYMDNEMVLVMAMFLGAAGGDVKAFDRVIQLLGKDIEHEELALKKRELKLKEQAASEKTADASEEVRIVDDV